MYPRAAEVLHCPIEGAEGDFQETHPECVEFEEIQCTWNAATFLSEIKYMLHNILWNKSYPDNMG